MKKREVRCSNRVETKDHQKVTCDSFIAELGEFEIIINCRKCKASYAISRKANGKYEARGFLREKLLTTKKKG